MNSNVSKLVNATAAAMRIFHPPLREIEMMKLANLANGLGYSFESFQRDNIWRTHEELEKQKPCETVESRVFASIKQEASCKRCGTVFNAKGNKLFCCEICRNKFHNEKKT